MSNSKAKVVHVKLTMRQAESLLALAVGTIWNPVAEKEVHGGSWPLIMAGRKAAQLLEEAILEADEYENFRRAG